MEGDVLATAQPTHQEGDPITVRNALNVRPLNTTEAFDAWLGALPQKSKDEILVTLQAASRTGNYAWLGGVLAAHTAEHTALQHTNVRCKLGEAYIRSCMVKTLRDLNMSHNGLQKVLMRAGAQMQD